MAALRQHEAETTFINAWAEVGTYDLVVNAAVSASMRRQKLDLLDVNNVLKTGRVVGSDMIGSRGLWDVRGQTTEGVWLVVRIAVSSAEPEVELLQVIK